MKIKFLGTGTSYGVPIIGCDCETCISKDIKNIRYRSSAWVYNESTSILIDMSPEFRIRALEYKIPKIDAVLFTHAHSDHCSGLDDIRRYNVMQNSNIPIYGNTKTLEDIKKKFFYIFTTTQEGGGKPLIEMKLIQDYENFIVNGIDILPLNVHHGELDITAFRIGDLAYITDVSNIPEETFEHLIGLKYLVLDALRQEKHPTHFSLQEAIESSQKIGAFKTYFTHIAHTLEHNKTQELLPKNTFLAYDGLELEF